MDLREYVHLVRRRWMLIVSTAVLGVLLAALLTLVVTPTYKSTTQLFVAIQGSGTVTELQQGNTFTQARVESYVRTATSPAVLQPAIDSLGLTVSAAEMASRIEAVAEPQTVLIRLSATSDSPAEAAAIAQASADSLIRVVEDLERPSDGGVSPVRLSVITPATAPVSPSSPASIFVLAAGLLGGLILGFFIALLRFVFDSKIRGESDIRSATPAAVLGGIIYDSDAASSPLITQVHSQSPRAESFRQIRTNLQFANVSSTSKTLLVTSSLPSEGKTTTATNMAIAMAQAGQRVVLVDADLRRPMTAKYLGLESNAGLTTALVGSAAVEDLLQPWGENGLFILTAGQIPPNPSELLGSEAMTQVIQRLEEIFDVVIIDAPPLIPVTDAAVLSQKVGGVVLVVGAGKIKTQDLEKSLASLALVEAKLRGIVMNFLPSKGPDAYSYSYYSYESLADAKSSKGQQRVTKNVSDSPSAPAHRSRRLGSKISVVDRD